MTLEIKKYWRYAIGAILAGMLMFTQFDSRGVEFDKKNNNRKTTNTVEIK